MLRIQSKGIHYHGWQFEICAQEEEFFFQCYHPELPDFCNDGLVYPSLKSASAAAYEFIDREIAIQALLEVVGEWLQREQISEQEYWNLTDFE